MLDRLTIERMASGQGPILVAVSGGGDSVALLHLLVEHFGAARLRAAVVDHALRSGSGEDAERARGFAEALDVPCEVLTLSWALNANRAQQAARRARYAALCAHARNIGASAIVVGHTADDQAETLLMRASAGSGYRGLAGMTPIAPAPLWPEGRGITLARPLLNTRREALRHALRERGAAWIEDPANANPQYERVRVRLRVAELETRGFDPLQLTAVAARLREHVESIDKAALALITAAATIDARVVIARDRWRGPAEVRRRALSALMAACAGADREPADAAVIEARVLAADYRGGTHGGVRFNVGPQGLTLLRDPGALLGRADGAAPAPPMPLPLEREVIWDGRFGFIARAAGWSVVAADNADVLAFARGSERRRLEQAGDIVAVRALASERLRHAFRSVG